MGRDDELEQISAAALGAHDGRGGLALIAGEPGIGKTRLAKAAAAQAATAGLRVVWGRCREEGGTPAHWPWVQVLRTLVQETDRQSLSIALAGNAHVLSAAVPEIASRLPAPVRHESAPSTRFAFFDAVETFLRTLAREMPLALILDDLHAADPSSLALLEFITPELSRARVLIIATYREHEASLNDAGPVIARVVRHGIRVRLTGLDYENVAALAAATAGHVVPGALVAAIQRSTEGNPLFVQEMVRTLAAKGALSSDTPPRYLELADSVQHVIEMRLAPLPPTATQVLAAAAVVGREFDVTTLEAVTGTDAYEILTHLQAAVDTGVAALVGGVRGSATFTHALYRELFYSRLPAAERAALHQRVAMALQRLNAEAYLPEIAFHLLEAGPVGDLAQAAEYARRAGEQASTRFAFAQAVKHYEDALRALAATGAPEADRCDLLLLLGEAHFRAGAREAATTAFRLAAGTARALGDPERLAHAANGLAGPWMINGGIAREDLVDVLQDALTALGAHDSAMRATLLARLTVEFYVSEPSRADALSGEALAIGRRLGHPRATAEALLARHLALLKTLEPKRLIDLSREALRLARRLRDNELGFRARVQLVNTYMNSGARAELDREFAGAARMAEQLRQPFYTWFVHAWRGAFALIDGRLIEAEALIEETFARGCATQAHEEMHQFAVPTYQAQSLNLRFEQGRGLADLEPAFRTIAETIPSALFRSALMWLHWMIGRRGDARDALAAFAADDFATLGSDWTFLPTVAFAAATCADVGDTQQARRLYERARPYAAHHVSNGSYYLGSMHHYLGRLSAKMASDAEAGAHFEDALAAHRRMGARCWVARTQLHYGELLSRSAVPSDVRRGTEFLHEALERARQIGMDGVIAAAERALAAREAAPSALPRPATPPAGATHAERADIVREGDVWTIEFAGIARQLKDMRGLHYLLPLLRHPGREFHASELVQAAVGAPATSGTGVAADTGMKLVDSLGGAGPLLDAQAAAAYREQLAELREERQSAQHCNDIGRAARLSDEIEVLTAELAAAARNRRTGSHGERARLAVTKGIKAALRKLVRIHPLLARHLEATVHTGYFCSYTPDPRHPITWQC